MNERERLIELLHGWARKENDGISAESIADYLLESGVIVPPCKVGDTVYVIPSKTNYRLNIINGCEENNRIYEQKVSEVRIFLNRKYLLTTCDGLRSVHSDLYGDTWFLTKEEAEQALEKEREK